MIVFSIVRVMSHDSELVAVCVACIPSFWAMPLSDLFATSARTRIRRGSSASLNGSSGPAAALVLQTHKFSAALFGVDLIVAIGCFPVRFYDSMIQLVKC